MNFFGFKVIRKCAQEQYKCLQNAEAHWEVVERILFIFSKLNPGVNYVQGMNEVIGPIYYVFASDSRPDWKGLFHFYTNFIIINYSISPMVFGFKGMFWM